ncbi:MAG: deoxyribodipyrimidine photo-lyase [Candidatus Gracilibacteria bacterium]|nr:deoxyribodipyrimidine photo-lyase [Candidatus Gracilibacteria bacterium]
MISSRVRDLNKKEKGNGPVLFWMDRERRMRDNWALVRAQQLALELERPLLVVYVLPAVFLDSAWRQHHFMIEGLKEVEIDLKKKQIPFSAVLGDPSELIPALAKKLDAAAVITDFSPLRVPRKWRSQIARHLAVRFEEVDARNIVPCWLASPKQEYGAYTLRPKIHRALEEYLDDLQTVKKHPFIWSGRFVRTDWDKIVSGLQVDRTVEPIDWLKPGEKAAVKVLKVFLEEKKKNYSIKRNDPTQDALSNLSPYLHFGMISAQRIALMAEGMDDFLEELIVRRELADNYCFYQPFYDSFKGFPEWAQKSLNEHRADERSHVYSVEQWENADTHDDLWNAAQMEMVRTGKMHGYMRMYWCKKILEWTKTPEEAQKIAIYLNDKYELDGRDSSGYVGIAWSIGGLHDRAWTEREVYGKVRYMNANGCKRKFDVKAYIQKHLGSDQAELFKPDLCK